MIPANELRVGNFVFHAGYPNDFQEVRGVCKDRVLPIELTEHDNNTIYAHQCTLSDLEPIPLTPEILEKCGFSKGKRHYTDVDSYYNHRYMVAYKWFHVMQSDGAVILNDNMQHLHQLQNLYFALTGEELTIKL